MYHPTFLAAILKQHVAFCVIIIAESVTPDFLKYFLGNSWRCSDHDIHGINNTLGKDFVLFRSLFLEICLLKSYLPGS